MQRSTITSCTFDGWSKPIPAPQEAVTEGQQGTVSYSLVLRVPLVLCYQLLVVSYYSYVLTPFLYTLRTYAFIFHCGQWDAAALPEHKLIMKSSIKKEERKDTSASLCLSMIHWFSYLNIFEKRGAWQLINTFHALDPPLPLQSS